MYNNFHVLGQTGMLYIYICTVYSIYICTYYITSNGSFRLSCPARCPIFSCRRSILHVGSTVQALQSLEYTMYIIELDVYMRIFTHVTCMYICRIFLACAMPGGSPARGPGAHTYERTHATAYIYIYIYR